MVVVSKLLDVPVETGLFGAGAKTYFLRVLDHKSRELKCSDDIQGGARGPSFLGWFFSSFCLPDWFLGCRAIPTSRHACAFHAYSSHPIRLRHGRLQSGRCPIPDFRHPPESGLSQAGLLIKGLTFTRLQDTR